MVLAGGGGGGDRGVAGGDSSACGVSGEGGPTYRYQHGDVRVEHVRRVLRQDAAQERQRVDLHVRRRALVAEGTKTKQTKSETPPLLWRQLSRAVRT